MLILRILYWMGKELFPLICRKTNKYRRICQSSNNSGQSMPLLSIEDDVVVPPNCRYKILPCVIAIDPVDLRA